MGVLALMIGMMVLDRTGMMILATLCTAIVREFEMRRRSFSVDVPPVSTPPPVFLNFGMPPANNPPSCGALSTAEATGASRLP